MTLTEFLLARIAEDETEAREAFDEGHSWLVEDNTISLWPDDREPFDGFMGFPRRSQARHAAIWQPSRVLAECEAKRRIVGLYREIRMSEPWGDNPPSPLGGDGPETYYEVIQLLAAVYADHPDFRDEWKL